MSGPAACDACGKMSFVGAESDADREYGDSFTDISGDQWYAEAVFWADDRKPVEGYGIISGTGAETLSPGEPATCAQVAAMAMRFLENVRS